MARSSRWSSGAEQLYGFTADELVGRTSLVLYPADRRSDWHQIVQRLQLGERSVQADTIHVTKDGRPIEVTLNVTAARDASGGLTTLSVVARDVTALRRVQAALQANRDRLAEVLETVGYGLLLLNDSGNQLAVNLLPKSFWAVRWRSTASAFSSCSPAALP